MTVFKVGYGKHYRPAYHNDKNYSIDYVIGYNNTAASSSTAISGDANETTIVSSYSDPYYDISLRGDLYGVKLSKDGESGYFNGVRLSRVSDGMCKIIAKHPLISKSIILDMDRINYNSYKVLENYVSGSLARNILDQMTIIIGSKTVESKPLYSLQDHESSSYIRNVNSWAASINLTAISPWNSRGGNTRSGTAITPRHIILAEHYPLVIGDSIRFIANDNTVVTRTISGIVNIPVSGADTQIALLNSALPASITPLKLLPANIYNYLPSITKWPIPLVTLDAEEKAIIKSTDPKKWSTSSLAANLINAINEPFAQMTEPIIVGDSGNPIMMIINGIATLVSHWSTPTLGPLYHKILTEIGSAITTLGGGYSLSTVNLSSFTDYS